MKNIICPICGKTVFSEYRNFDICGFCGWENDGPEDANECAGANELSASEFQKRYKIYSELYPDYTWKKYLFPEITKEQKALFFCKYSLANEKAIENSHFCGCFFCGKIFDKNLISQWINDRDGKTAVCPYCGIDSVLPDSKADLSEELLEDMYRCLF